MLNESTGKTKKEIEAAVDLVLGGILINPSLFNTLLPILYLFKRTDITCNLRFTEILFDYFAYNFPIASG